MKIISKIFIILVFLFSALCVAAPCLYADKSANPSNTVCAVYITGSGCSNCAVVDPVLLREIVSKYPDLIIFEYSFSLNIVTFLGYKVMR